MAKIKVYFSGSVVNAMHIDQIVSLFPNDNFKFFLPHKFTKPNIPHSKYSKNVFEKCLKLMEQSDIGIINLDCFGKDSSWECGWYYAHDKPLIGYVSTNLSFLKDWMIKGGLDGVLVNNDFFCDVIKSDPILKFRKENILKLEKNNITKQIKLIIKNDRECVELKNGRK